jgi:hypothetical protein
MIAFCMKRYIQTLIVLLLCLGIAPSVSAAPGHKKKTKKRHHSTTTHTPKAMQQKHLNRTLQEKGFVRFKDSMQKAK